MGSVVRGGIHTAHQLLGVDGRCTAVRTFAKHKRNIHVQLRIDNKMAIFYVNCMGGNRAQNLVQPGCQLWQWCLQWGITLSAEYLPVANNAIADKES